MSEVKVGDELAFRVDQKKKNLHQVRAIRWQDVNEEVIEQVLRLLKPIDGLRSADVAKRDKIKQLTDEWCEHSSDNMDVLAWSCIDKMEAILRDMKP